MKIIITISICFLLGSQLLNAQESLKIDLVEKKKEVIYMELIRPNKLHHFNDNIDNAPDSKENVNAKPTT